MASTSYITFSGTVATGMGFSADGTLPAGAVACSAAQAQQFPQATLNNGTIVVGAAPSLPPAQAAAAAYAAFIAGGLTVTSTGTLALDGVYAIGSGDQTNIAQEAQFISTFGEFTNQGTVNLVWPLANGGTVVFPTTAEFLSFAKVAGQTVGGAKQAVTQASTIMPSATVTIP